MPCSTRSFLEECPPACLRHASRAQCARPRHRAGSSILVGFQLLRERGRGSPAGQGPRRPADVLRLPRRALEACTHDQPHREHVRHGSSAHLPDQGLPVTQDGDGHGLQTMPVRSKKMEKTRWIEPSRRDHSRHQIRRWRTPGSRRRMISPYTTFDGAVKSCWPMACLYRSLRFGEEYLPVSALLVDKT